MSEQQPDLRSNINVIELIDFHSTPKIKTLEGEINAIASQLAKLVLQKAQIECHSIVANALKTEIE